MASSVPCSRYSSCQNARIKRGSRSVTIELGMPWSRKILETNTIATISLEKELERAMKWSYLNRWSTKTMMAIFPRDGGNSMMKSMEISLKT